MARVYADTDELYRVVILFSDNVRSTYGPYSELRTARAQASRVFSEHEKNAAHYARLAERVGFTPRVTPSPLMARIERGALDWQLVEADWA